MVFETVDQEIEAQIKRILRKLLEVRKKRLACFGSDRHAFCLSRPVSAEAIRAFEESHGIELPADYRAFLLRAGDGGAGPYYGIYTLSEWDELVGMADNGVPDDLLSRPSTLQPGRNEIGDYSEENFIAQCQGTISIGTQGCTYYVQLIVTGDCRGRVAYLDSGQDVPAYVAREPTFLSWYERWLDELLNGYDDSWFGYGPGGGEAEFLEILDEAEAESDLRREAVEGFARLPRVSVEGQKRVVAALIDADPDVREAACNITGHLKLRAGLDKVCGLLEDPVAKVRQAAVRTAFELSPSEVSDLVKSLMQREIEVFVQLTMLHELREAGSLTGDELLALASSSPHGEIRREAIHHHQWCRDQADHVPKFLRDPDARIRVEAARGAKCLQLPAHLSVVLEQLALEDDAEVIDDLIEALGNIGDPSCGEVLRTWCRSNDDFHRLAAFKALLRIGDDHVQTIANELMQLNRTPERVSPRGGRTFNTKTISDLVRKALTDARSSLSHKVFTGTDAPDPIRSPRRWWPFGPRS